MGYRCSDGFASPYPGLGQARALVCTTYPCVGGVHALVVSHNQAGWIIMIEIRSVEQIITVTNRPLTKSAWTKNWGLIVYMM
jgi:hypothetical protein